MTDACYDAEFEASSSKLVDGNPGAQDAIDTMHRRRHDEFDALTAGVEEREFGTVVAMVEPPDNLDEHLAGEPVINVDTETGWISSGRGDHNRHPGESPV